MATIIYEINIIVLNILSDFLKFLEFLFIDIENIYLVKVIIQVNKYNK